MTAARQEMDVFPTWYGVKGALTSIGTKVQCHVCGKAFHHLGWHVKRTHALEADEYRELFSLNRGTGLLSPQLARKRAAVGQLTRLAGSTRASNGMRGKNPKWRLQGRASITGRKRDRVTGKWV